MPLMIFYLCARTLIYVYMFGGYCCCLLKYSWSPWPCPVSEGLACHYKLLLGLAAERGSTVALYEHYLQKPGLLSTLCQEMESHTRRMWVFASGRRGDNNRGFCSASSKWCLCCRLRRECLWVLTDDAWFYLLTNRWHTFLQCSYSASPQWRPCCGLWKDCMCQQCSIPFAHFDWEMAATSMIWLWESHSVFCNFIFFVSVVLSLWSLRVWMGWRIAALED